MAHATMDFESRLQMLRDKRQELAVRREELEKSIHLRESTAAEFHCITLESKKAKAKTLKAAARSAEKRNEEFIRSIHEAHQRVRDNYIQSKNDISRTRTSLEYEKKMYIEKVVRGYPAWQKKLRRKRLERLRRLEAKKQSMEQRRRVATKGFAQERDIEERIRTLRQEIELEEHLAQNQVYEHQVLQSHSTLQEQKFRDAVRVQAATARSNLESEVAAQDKSASECKERQDEFLDALSPRSALKALTGRNQVLISYSNNPPKHHPASTPQPLHTSDGNGKNNTSVHPATDLYGGISSSGNLHPSHGLLPTVLEEPEQDESSSIFVTGTGLDNTPESVDAISISPSKHPLASTLSIVTDRNQLEDLKGKAQDKYEKPTGVSRTDQTSASLELDKGSKVTDNCYNVGQPFQSSLQGESTNSLLDAIIVQNKPNCQTKHQSDEDISTEKQNQDKNAFQITTKGSFDDKADEHHEEEKAGASQEEFKATEQTGATNVPFDGKKNGDSLIVSDIVVPLDAVSDEVKEENLQTKDESLQIDEDVKKEELASSSLKEETLSDDNPLDFDRLSLSPLSSTNSSPVKPMKQDKSESKLSIEVEVNSETEVATHPSAVEPTIQLKEKDSFEAKPLESAPQADDDGLKEVLPTDTASFTSSLSGKDRLAAVRGLTSRLDDAIENEEEVLVETTASDDKKRELIKMAIRNSQSGLAFESATTVLQALLDVVSECGPYIFPPRAFEGRMSENRLNELHRSNKEYEVDTWKILSAHMRQLAKKAMKTDKVIEIYTDELLRQNGNCDNRMKRKLREFLAGVCGAPLSSPTRSGLTLPLKDSSIPNESKDKGQLAGSKSADTFEESKSKEKELSKSSTMPSLLQNAFLTQTTSTFSASGKKSAVENVHRPTRSPQYGLGAKLLSGGKMRNLFETDDDDVDLGSIVGGKDASLGKKNDVFSSGSMKDTIQDNDDNDEFDTDF